MAIPGEMLREGWGVVRMKPWHLAGVFNSSLDAEAWADLLGADYIIKYGDHIVGSPDFSFASDRKA